MTVYLFDLDGTLTDAREGLHASFRAALEALGVAKQSDEALDRFLGTPLPEMFRAVKPGIAEAEIDKGMNAFRSYYESGGISGNQLYPGVLRMLDAVARGGFTAWVVTSKPETYARQVVKQLGIERGIAGVVGAGLHETDTKTSLIAKALDCAKAGSEAAVMLGDRHYDVVGALDNGVPAVGALWGYGSYEELRDAGCRFFARSADEFRERFVQSGAWRSNAQRLARRARDSTGA